MLMQMLAAGGIDVLADHVRAADEDNRRGYFEFEPVKHTRRDPAWLEQATGKAVKMVYLLLYDLPNDREYRVVMMDRPLADVLASQRVMLERRGEAGANLSDDQLAGAFTRQRQQLEKWLHDQPNFSTLQIDYDAVLADSAGQAARIDEFLGGTLDQAAMARAVEPALRRHQSSRE